MTIRLLSGSYNHVRLGNSFKNTWYSALYTKSKSKKVSELISNKSEESKSKATTNNFNPTYQISSNFHSL